MKLTKEQQAILDGEKGETLSKVMQTIIRYGELFGAENNRGVTAGQNAEHFVLWKLFVNGNEYVVSRKSREINANPVVRIIADAGNVRVVTVSSFKKSCTDGTCVHNELLSGRTAVAILPIFIK